MGSSLDYIEQQAGIMEYDCIGAYEAVEIETASHFNSVNGYGIYLDGEFYIFRGREIISENSFHVPGVWHLDIGTMNFTHISGNDSYRQPPHQLFYHVFHPENTARMYFVESVVRGGSNSHYAYYFDVRARTWTRVTDMPEVGSDIMAQTCHGSFCYFHGGRIMSTSNPTNAFFQYDVEKDEWEDLTQPSSPFRTLHDLAYFPEEDALLLFGGLDESDDVVHIAHYLDHVTALEYETGIVPDADWSSMLIRSTVASDIEYSDSEGIRGGTSVFYNNAVYVMDGMFESDARNPILRISILDSFADVSLEAFWLRGYAALLELRYSTSILFGSKVLLLGGGNDVALQESVSVVHLC